MVELLLRAGADPNARDREFDATPSAGRTIKGTPTSPQYLESLETDTS